MIFLQKFLTNWRAQRGKFLTTSLMFRDFSYETLCVDKIISSPRGILWVDKIGSPYRRILCVDKIGFPGKPATPCWGYNIRPQRVLLKENSNFHEDRPQYCSFPYLKSTNDRFSNRK